MPRRHIALAVAVAVIWGVNFVVIHVGLDSFPPLLFAALRFGLVALALPFVGLGNVATRKARSPHPVGLLVWSSLIPPLPLLALSLLTERGEPVAIDAPGVLALLYVVGLSTFVGFGAWAWLLGRHPASTVAPFTLLVPVVGIAAAWLALGETPSVAELSGALVVLAGLALTVGLTLPRRQRPASHAPSPQPSPS